MSDDAYDHRDDDDPGVPFWRRAAITDGQLARMRRELAEARAELEAALAEVARLTELEVQ